MGIIGIIYAMTMFVFLFSENPVVSWIGVGMMVFAIIIGILWLKK